MSDTVDEAAAALLAQEVSDAVIAPGFEPAALELLKEKKRGKYLVLEADPEVELPKTERRDLLGVTLEQPRNDARLTVDDLRAGIVTEKRELPDDAARDLLLATIALKYTQSNSVTLASGGQLVGVGCGQQSRIHCVQLAANKAQLWHLRRSPLVQAHLSPRARQRHRLVSARRDDAEGARGLAHVLLGGAAPAQCRRAVRLAGSASWHVAQLGRVHSLPRHD
jgi:AICAR transformylase/IMP cyclohydrolase PurH